MNKRPTQPTPSHRMNAQHFRIMVLLVCVCGNCETEIFITVNFWLGLDYHRDKAQKI